MVPIQTVATAGFWTCASLVLYVYVGYPILVWILARVFGREARPPVGSEDVHPHAVSMIIAVCDEEAVIGDRLRNALEMDYPSQELEIIVGSDGSIDRTTEIVHGFADRGVRLLEFARRRGKAAVVNDAAAAARGEVLLMTDANTHFNPAAARKLTRWFRDPSVGAVIGRLVLVDPCTGANADGLYWEYETFLKRCEARLGASMANNGAIYALRRALYEPIPPAMIADDLIIPLRAKLRTGCKIVYDPEAIALEETAPDVRAEFYRRARIGAGGFGSIGMLWKLLDPRRGWIAVAFLSHKVLRWLCPFFLIGALLGSLVLRDRQPYRAALLAQVGFYATSLLMARVPTRHRLLRPLRLATMFTTMNAALLVGFWRWLSGRSEGAWRRTARADQAEGRYGDPGGPGHLVTKPASSGSRPGVQ
jgi:cellulose synthase/poly-beta-1,6-N-acetylglucosamine synthase-like glycosyltransferase